MADGWGPPATDDQTPITVADNTGWGPPADAPKPEVKKPDDSGPMPGPLDALGQGLKRAFGTATQTGEVLEGKKPTDIAPDTSPAAGNFEWRDLLEPSRGLSKLTYHVGASSPTLAGGILGGAAGSAIEPGLGTAVGGAGGAATGAALQTLGPSFSQELKKSPSDPEGAWRRAMETAAASGAFSGAAWALFPAKFFEGPVKNLAFQALGVQPGLGVAEQATHNVITGDDATKGLGTAYVQGAVGTAVPALGHVALKGRFGEPETVNPEPTQAQVNASAADKITQSQGLINQSMDPSLSPAMAKRLLQKAGDLHEAASFELDRAAAPAREEAKRTQADQLEQQAMNPALSPAAADQLNAQARELRRDADYDGFIARMAPPSPKPSDTLWGKIKNSYINNVQPEIASDAALRTDPTFGFFKSQQAQTKDALIYQGEKLYYKWNKLPEQDRVAFMTAMETNQPVPQALAAKAPWTIDAAKSYREQLNADYTLENQMGSKAHYLDNYFPHIWKDVEKARQTFEPQRLLQSMGPNWFQKARTYDLIQHGLDNGLELKSTNPQDLMTQRRLSSVDMVNKMDMLHTLERQGVAVPAENAPPQVTNPRINGGLAWEPVSAPNGQQWMIAPDVSPLWKNAVEAKGLWANEGMVGDGFRKWMGLKSAWVPIKLGLSLFHPVHVAHINFVNNMSRALGETFGKGEQGLLRRLVATPEALLQSVADTFFQAPPIGTPFVGKRMRESWLTPRELQTDQQKADNRLMNEAGISAQLSEQLKIQARRNISDAISQAKYYKVPHNILGQVSKFLTSPIFEEWIPNLKVAALKREAETLFRRRPDLLTNPEQRRVALRTIGKQIDNRFGEMFYGSLFWNRTLKDASIGSFLSLGWNLGFAREFGGGTFEPIVRRMIDAPTPTRKLIRDVSNKTTNMVVYSMTAMMINAAMTKALSGDNPNGMDYIFPRIGGLNPDGSPRRITNAFYTREVPMAMKNVEERQSVVGGLAQMMYHKMMFAPFAEMGQNKDYFGNQIMDENAPLYQQTAQFMKHLLTEQLNPMSISGAKRALQLSGKPHDTLDVFKQLNDFDAYGSFLGFGPAPSYASKSALDNRIQYLFRQLVAPSERSSSNAEASKAKSDARTDYLGAQQRGDHDAMVKAATKLAQLGVKTKEISKLQPGGPTLYMFSRLPALDQRDLLKQMSPDDFKKYYLKSNKAIRSDPEIAPLAVKYFRQQAS